MKFKYLVILFMVLGFALFVNINLTDSSTTQNTSTTSFHSDSVTILGINGHTATVNEVCSGVGCPFPNSVNVTTV